MNIRKLHFFALTVLVGLLFALWPGKARPSTAQRQSEPTPASQSELSNSPQAISNPSGVVFSYQGQLLDANKEPVDGQVDMIFDLYDRETGGTPLWTESYTGPEAITVTDGLFHVLLGSVSPISATGIISGDFYLELTIDGETLAPRELLTSVAYAVKASTVPDGAITANKLHIDAPVQMNGNMLKGGLVWFSSYDQNGSQTALPGFMDTLYYGVERGISVEANRDPDAGELARMFNLHPGSYAQWNNVTITNPVVITVTYKSDKFLNGVSVAFGWRNSHAIDYTLEYYEDNEDDNDYTWTKVAEVSGNSEYQVYHPVRLWRVRKIRLVVTDAGNGSEAKKLRVATIQAPSGIYGKDTGHLMDVGGDTMYGDLNMNRNNIAAIGSVEIDGSGQSIFNNPQDVTTQGDAALRFGSGSNWLGIDNNEIASYGDPLHLQASDANTPVQVHTDLGVDGYITLKTANSDWARIEGHGKGTGDDGGMDFKLGDDSGVNFRWYVKGQERMKLAGSGDLAVKGVGVFGTSGQGEGGEIQLVEGSGGIRWYMDNYNNTLRWFNSGAGGTMLMTKNGDVSITGNMTCGGLVEANLQTEEELNSDQINRFEEGDVLCWGIDQLELCSIANDRLVQAVADGQGRPIVLGAEVIKAIGPVQRGDILVASDVPGYAMVNNDPVSGSVIAQALEDFDGERGVIRAMIRKW